MDFVVSFQQKYLIQLIVKIPFPYTFIQMQDMVGDGTKELDLMGKIVVPGFIDSHVHLISGGLQVWHKCHS